MLYDTQSRQASYFLVPKTGMQCLALLTILCSAFLIKSFYVMLWFPILLNHSKWLFSIKKLLHSILPNSKELPKSRKIQEEKVDFSRGTKFLGGSCFAFGYIKKDFESLLFQNRLQAYFTWHIYSTNLANLLYYGPPFSWQFHLPCFNIKQNCKMLFYF